MELKELVEKLADLEHIQWQNWMNHLLNEKATLLSKKRNEVVILFSKDDYYRWIDQMKKPYEELSEKEKNSDREYAIKAIHIVWDYLGENGLILKT